MINKFKHFIIFSLILGSFFAWFHHHDIQLLKEHTPCSVCIDGQTKVSGFETKTLVGGHFVVFSAVFRAYLEQNDGVVSLSSSRAPPLFFPS